jgi:hypothetical protein
MFLVSLHIAQTQGRILRVQANKRVVAPLIVDIGGCTQGCIVRNGVRDVYIIEV